MLSLQRKLTESCSLIPVTRNRHGDLVYGTAVTTNCMYRDISTLRQVDYKEGVSIEGIFWFPPTAAATKGSVISYSNEHYRIVKVIKGKRNIIDHSVDFLKCEVTNLRQIS